MMIDVLIVQISKLIINKRYKLIILILLRQGLPGGQILMIYIQ